MKKPTKKSDKDLFAVIEHKIARGEYLFLKHAKQRLFERHIVDLDVLKILKGRRKFKRKRNKRKDTFQEGMQDWNYCIEGANLDGVNIRIIISFMNNLMPIITVIKLK